MKDDGIVPVLQTICGDVYGVLLVKFVRSGKFLNGSHGRKFNVQTRLFSGRAKGMISERW